MKIRIEMDEKLTWWPVCEDDQVVYSKPMTLEVDKALYEEYCTFVQVKRKMYDKLEQLFRIQEGITTWPDIEIPDYKLLDQ